MQGCMVRWVAGILGVLTVASSLQAANYRTPNFIIDAPTAEFAKKIGDAAEVYRNQMAIEWTGKAMPNWSRPCLITVHVGPNLGAGPVGSAWLQFSARWRPST